MSELEYAKVWNERFASTDAYVFGEAPNAFLAAQAPRLKPGWRALAVSDGEGRNGVWLAEQGLEVRSIDISAVAQAKAAKLAAARGVRLALEQVDMAAWAAPEAAYDLVAAIFIQYAGPSLRARIFEGMKRAVKPGGLILLEGYRVEQIAYGTGGPKIPENMYDEAMLREAFGDFDILELRAYDAAIDEGAGHSGMSALIDLVARRPA
jgi:SAM-dependent methyltransferase